MISVAKAQAIEYHTAEARELATQAGNQRVNGQEDRAELSAQVSQAHSLAVLAMAVQQVLVEDKRIEVV